MALLLAGLDPITIFSVLTHMLQDSNFVPTVCKAGSGSLR